MTEKKKRLIFWIVYLAYTSIYMARVNLSMAGPDMIEGKILDTVELGLLGSVFSTLYSVGRLINGVVIKSFGYTPMFVSWAVISVISIVVIKMQMRENA